MKFKQFMAKVANPHSVEDWIIALTSATQHDKPIDPKIAQELLATLKKYRWSGYSSEIHGAYKPLEVTTLYDDSNSHRIAVYLVRGAKGYESALVSSWVSGE